MAHVNQDSESNTQRTFREEIECFDRYVMDVNIAVTWVSTLWPDTSIFVLGESMGASIAMHSLLIAPTQPTIAVTGREELGCRDQAFNTFLRADPLFVRYVSARFLTVLTIWLWQSKRKAREINLPLLVLLGGRDKIARRSGTSAFLRKVSSREQRIVTFPQAYHCLLRDPDTPDVVQSLNFWLTTRPEE